MSFNSNSIANAQRDTSYAHLLPRRVIPSNCSDDERWVLETSGWMNYAWGVSDEDENALRLGLLPPSAVQYTPPAVPLTNASVRAVTVQPPTLYPQDHSTAGETRDNFDSFKGRTQSIPSQIQPMAAPPRYASAHTYGGQPVTVQSVTAIDYDAFFKTLPNGYTHPDLASLSSCSSSTSSRSSTPSLSPGSSQPSDSDWESELTSSRESSASPSLASSSKSVLPPSLLPVAPGSEYTLPTGLGPEWYAPEPSGSPSSSAGAIRITSSRSTEKAAPYSRKYRPRKAVNDSAAKDFVPTPEVLENPLACAICGYVQVRGPGDVRSYKRHLQTHKEYSRVEWRCRGVKLQDGSYSGGCNKTFARKDALQRHVKCSNCVSDFEPVQILKELDFMGMAF